MLSQIPEAEWEKAGDRTRELMLVRAFPGVKQGAAARALGFSQTTLSRVMQGKMPLSEDFAKSADRALAKRSGSDEAPEFVYEAGEIISIWFRTTDDGLIDTATPGDEAAGSPPWSVELVRRRFSGRTLLAAGVMLVLVGAFLLRSLDRFGGGGDAADAAGSSLSACNITPIEFEPDLVDQYQGWGERMYQEYLDVRIEYVDLCPIDFIRESPGGSVLIQRMEDADGRQMVLMATSSANAIGLNRAQWISLIEAQSVAGVEVLPLRFKIGVQGSRITMSNGSELVGAEAEQRHVLVSEAVMDAWVEQGGPDGPFGWPMSHGYKEGDRARTDFTGGYFLVDQVDGDDQIVTPVPDRSAGLSRNDLPSLLALPDGSIWLVTDESDRHWVMDAETNSCLRRLHDGPEVVSGEELAQFPLGEPATCG